MSGCARHEETARQTAHHSHEKSFDAAVPADILSRFAKGKRRADCAGDAGQNRSNRKPNWSCGEIRAFNCRTHGTVFDTIKFGRNLAAFIDNQLIVLSISPADAGIRNWDGIERQMFTRIGGNFVELDSKGSAGIEPMVRRDVCFDNARCLFDGRDVSVDDCTGCRYHIVARNHVVHELCLNRIADSGAFAVQRRDNFDGNGASRNNPPGMRSGVHERPVVTWLQC